MPDIAYYKCPVEGCGEVIEGEMVADPTFGTRVEEHEAQHAVDARLVRLIEVAREISGDCKTDADALDGQPFTGRTVAENFGSTLAMLATLATAVAEIGERVLALEAERR